MKPFSSGTQFEDWIAANCDRCQAGSWRQNPSEMPSCPLEAALVIACFDDGEVEQDIANRIGYTAGAYQWRCGEWEPTEGAMLKLKAQTLDGDTVEFNVGEICANWTWTDEGLTYIKRNPRWITVRTDTITPATPECEIGKAAIAYRKAEIAFVKAMDCEESHERCDEMLAARRRLYELLDVALDKSAEPMV